MEVMTKVVVFALAGTLCAGVVRRGAPEFSILLALGTGMGVLLLSFDALRQVLEMVERMAQLAQLDQEILRPMIKTIALSILTKITSEVCKAAGEGGVAAFVETAGTVLALGVALPLAEGVLELMGRLLA